MLKSLKGWLNPEKNLFSKRYRVLAVFTVAMFLVGHTFAVFAQKSDTSKNVPVQISALDVYYVKTDSGAYNRFIGNAVFIQGTDTLYCDSLYRNNTTNIVEAYSNVRVRQADGTNAVCDYLRYTSSGKLAYMHGNVVLIDAPNNLKCQDLTYNLGTKTGDYTTGGVLHTDSSTVTSMEGEYVVSAKEARFKKKVHVVDVRYEIVSDDLGYNTDTRLVTFYAPSVVTSDSGRQKLKTSNGTYESVTGTAHFTGHSSVMDGEYYLEGDTIYYNKPTGYGYANGHVISIDTTKHSTMFCEHLEYFRFKRVSWATGKPVLKQVNGKDTLYIRADTFYSFPAVRTDTVKVKKDNESTDPYLVCFLVSTIDTGKEHDITRGLPWFLGFQFAVNDFRVMADKPVKKQNNKEAAPSDDKKLQINTLTNSQPVAAKQQVPKATPEKPAKSKSGKPVKGKVVGGTAIKKDTTAADTTAPMMFVGYHHVLIFSDSMQGKCDSVSYSQADSTIRMIYKPIAWSHLSQITGDTILLRMDDSGKMKSLFVPNNSFVVSQSGPEKAGLFDQVQGQTLTAYFENNTINKLVVVPDAQAIYYTKDSRGAYVGESEAKSERMKIYFEKQQIQRILFEKDITQIMTPLEKANLPEARLGRFSWQIDSRPKTKEELFK